MTKVKLLSDTKEYFDMLTANEVEVTDASFGSNDVWSPLREQVRLCRTEC